MNHAHYRVLCFIVLLVACAGCVGTGTGDVTGVVTYRGKPLPAGTISFYDATRGVWSSAIGPDGSYSVAGIPTGTARIAVVTPMAISMPGAPPPPKSVPIPAKYADPDKSGLTCVVGRGSQTHDVTLTD